MTSTCHVLLVTSVFALSFVSSHWVTRVLLPSGHDPRGDGLTWDVFPVKKDLIPVWQTLPRHTCSLISAVFAVSNPLWSFDLVGLKDPCMVAPYSCRNGVKSTSNTSKTCCGIAHGLTVYIFHQWQGNVPWMVCSLLGFTDKLLLLDSERCANDRFDIFISHMYWLTYLPKLICIQKNTNSSSQHLLLPIPCAHSSPILSYEVNCQGKPWQCVIYLYFVPIKLINLYKMLYLNSWTQWVFHMLLHVLLHIHRLHFCTSNSFWMV